MKRLSLEQQEKIRQLALAGIRSTHIGLQLKIDRNSVTKYRKAMHLSTKPILPEQKILSLLRKRVGQWQIARTLKVPYRKVRAIAHAHGFGQPRRQLSVAQSLQLIEDILDRRGSAAAIAKRYNASYKKVLAIAHRLLKCERFLPTWKHPLSSYGPSRPPRSMLKNGLEGIGQLVIRLVDKICSRFLNGALPTLANENGFVRALSIIVVPVEGSPDLQGCPREMVRANFEAHLREAIQTLRASQKGLVN